MEPKRGLRCRLGPTRQPLCILLWARARHRSNLNREAQKILCLLRKRLCRCLGFRPVSQPAVLPLPSTGLGNCAVTSQSFRVIVGQILHP